MAIITYQGDGSPEGIRKRLNRKNCKTRLVFSLQKIHHIRHDEKLTDQEKIKQIGEILLDSL